MSEYVDIATQLRDAEAIVQALVDLGFARHDIEVHAQPVPLYGYAGDQRPERAHIVIRRHAVGKSSNDLGFVRIADGTFRAVISEYDQRTPGRCGPYDRAFLGRLTQRYALHTLRRHYEAQGRQVQVHTRQDGVVEVHVEH